MKKQYLFFIWVMVLITPLFISCSESKPLNPKESVWNTIQELNKQWAFEEDLDSIAKFLDDDMVVITPGKKERFIGKKAILDSYVNYMAYAETISLEEKDELVQLYNDNRAAVVSYYAELIYTNPQGDTIHFSGREMYTLVWKKGKWLAVSQQYSTNPG